MKPMFTRGQGGAAAHRLRRGRGRARAARGAGRGRRRPREADPGRPAAGDRAAHRALRPARAARARTSSSSTPSTTRATATTGRPTTSSPSARACRRSTRSIEMRRRHDADRRDDDPQGRGRRHALRHVRHARAAPALHRPGDRPARRACAVYAAMNALMLPGAHGVHLRHLRQRRSRRRADRRDDAARGRGDRAASASRRRSALLSHSNFGSVRHASARKMRAGARADPRSARPSSRSRARCTATPRSPRRSACGCSRNSRLRGEANLLDHADARRRQHLVQPAEDRGRRRRHASGPILLGAAQAGAHPHAVGDRAAHRQHDRARGRRRQRAARPGAACSDA